jgi:hypothetical protein
MTVEGNPLARHTEMAAGGTKVWFSERHSADATLREFVDGTLSIARRQRTKSHLRAKRKRRAAG